MICPKCGHEQMDGQAECLACGVIFSKLRQMPAGPAGGAGKRPSANAQQEQENESALRSLLLPEPAEANPIAVAIKGVLWVALAVWAFKFITSPVARNYAGESLLHLVNLPFHEAGHIVFSPFGRFTAVLGGTMMQLLMPLVCLCVLLIRTRDAFGASVGLWWLGQNFMDIAPYINDARDLKLILLGGVTGRDVADFHDWEFILRKLGLLRMDHVLAGLSQFAGSLLMVAALTWGAVCLWKQVKTMRSSF